MTQFTVPSKASEHALALQVHPFGRVVVAVFATLTLPLPSQSKHPAPFLSAHESAWYD